MDWPCSQMDLNRIPRTTFFGQLSQAKCWIGRPLMHYITIAFKISPALNRCQRISAVNAGTKAYSCSAYIETLSIRRSRRKSGSHEVKNPPYARFFYDLPYTKTSQSIGLPTILHYLYFQVVLEGSWRTFKQVRVSYNFWTIFLDILDSTQDYNLRSIQTI